jgi:tetratricopeptide (TPR) repeat protein|tara:strand:+ start:129 stop:860 length:732 start_codon:yes stop_codon:yes gene_type:complete
MSFTKSNKMKYKFWIFLSIALLTQFSSAAEMGINSADSLFKAKKYTEAQAVYENILAEKSASPAMILKLGFIEEGLGNYVKALFYLNQYFLMTTNKKVLLHMREIAEGHNLEGYEYSDVEFFGDLYLRYKNHIVLSLSTVAFLLTFLSYQRKIKRRSFKTFLSLQLVVLVILSITANDALIYKQGIIAKDNTVLMSGPSAGAEPVDIVQKGHRIKILDRQDTWIKALWNEQEVYIKDQKLLII